MYQALFFPPSSQRSKEAKKEKIIKKITPDLRLETSAPPPKKILDPPLD